MPRVFIEVTETRAISSDNKTWMLMRRTKKKDKATGKAIGGYSEWAPYSYPTSYGHAAKSLEKELTMDCGAQSFPELARLNEQIHKNLMETYDRAGGI
jgi:hypothetical protein